MAKLGECAVVLGASMGGLLAARALADFFETVTVLERDVLPDDPAVRRGVPQGRHVHVLLARGAQILDELFAGFLSELVAAGAPVWDDGELSKLHLSFGGHDILRSGKVVKEPKALAIHMPSRPFLECHVRRRLQAMRNVTILSGHEVTEVTATPDRTRVTGVRVVDRDGTERELTADVVMDAMGRGAHLLVCGDAICSVNPVYGQGMTLAALEAAALRECLRGGGTDLPRRYFRASAKPIGVAWQMVASSDLAFPEVAGRRSRWMRVATRLVDWAMAASESDLGVAVPFFRVNSLVDSPIRLLHPAFLYRVAAVNLRRRRGDGQPRQAEIVGRAG